MKFMYVFALTILLSLYLSSKLMVYTDHWPSISKTPNILTIPHDESRYGLVILGAVVLTTMIYTFAEGHEESEVAKSENVEGAGGEEFQWITTVSDEE